MIALNSRAIHYYLMQGITGSDGSGNELSDGLGDGLKPMQNNASSVVNASSSTSQENQTETIKSQFQANSEEEEIPFEPSQRIEPSQNNGFNPSLPPSSPPSQQASPSVEPDWDSFPHRTSNSIEAKRNRATLIKTRMLAAIQSVTSQTSKLNCGWCHRA